MSEQTELRRPSKTETKRPPATDKSALTIPHAGLPGEATPTGWIPPRQPMTLDQWAGVGKIFGRATTSMRWLLGDWWAFGKFDYGDKCRALAASGIDLDVHTLTNYSGVSKAFSTMSRRRDILSFGHHEAVCTLAAREADALLDKAEREGLSRHALRLLVSDRHAEELASREATLAEPPYGAEDIDAAPQRPLPAVPPIPPSTNQPDTDQSQMLGQFHRGVGDLAALAERVPHDVLYFGDFPLFKLRLARDLLDEVINKRAAAVELQTR
jgi:hypothetical protein